MNEKVISKINKLMALTKSSNKYESKKAAELAFKLMEENGISSKDLDMANGYPVEEEEPLMKRYSFDPANNTWSGPSANTF